MFCKCFTVLQKCCRGWVHVKQNILRPRHSRRKSATLKHFSKCYIVHVTTFEKQVQVVFDPAKNVFATFLQMFWFTYNHGRVGG